MDTWEYSVTYGVFRQEDRDHATTLLKWPNETTDALNSWGMAGWEIVSIQFGTRRFGWEFGLFKGIISPKSLGEVTVVYKRRRT